MEDKMESYVIIKNGITFEIDPKTDKYGCNRIIARLGEESTIGTLPGIPQRAYPRIEFRFKHIPWLFERADSRGWIVDDYETEEETRQRPTDTCEFNLTDAEANTITLWRNPAPGSPTPTPTSPSTSVRPIFAIGGLNLGDGAEVPAPYPKIGKTCKRCGSAESDGAMFTTLAGSDICDDCVA